MRVKTSNLKNVTTRDKKIDIDFNLSSIGYEEIISLL